MTYDIIQIDKWEAPTDDGAAILTMPNIPSPCHKLCPRTIEPKRWEFIRKKCYMDANYTCQASGAELGHGKLHAHELMSVDWKKCTMTFARPVALDPRLHTRFIHSGRALTLYRQGDPQMPKSALLATLEQGFDLISNYNMKHYDEEPLRVYETILEWAKEPSLEYEVNRLIEKYKIKFYSCDKRCFNAKNWSKWKLVYNGKDYPTLYPTQKDWEEAMNPKPNEEKPDEDKTLSMLDAILKEES